MLSTMAYNSLTELFDSGEQTVQSLAALCVLRRKHVKITHAALSGLVWYLATIGAISWSSASADMDLEAAAGNKSFLC